MVVNNPRIFLIYLLLRRSFVCVFVFLESKFFFVVMISRLFAKISPLILEFSLGLFERQFESIFEKSMKESDLN